MATILLATCLGAGWAGCAVFQVPEAPPTPTPIQPVWSDDELEDHIEFLNSGDAGRRTTGTQGFAQAAVYVAARLREFNLQPPLHDEYRIVYSTPINYPLFAGLRTVGDADSTLFFPGIDILADGRSDSGSVAVQTLVMTDDTTGIHSPPAGPFGVVFRSGEPSAETQASWRAAGAVLAVSVQPLTPRFARRRIPGLVAVQLNPRAMVRLLSPGQAAAQPGSVVRMQQWLVANVQADYEAQAGAMNVMAYVAGKHPRHARELVLVCTDLDAVSEFGGIQTLDFQNFGVETAALLEVARNLGFVSRRWSLPERSVMFAVWSGSQLGHAGMRHFLENPTWSLDRVTSVVYMGLSSEDEPEVRRMLAEKGLPLDVIPAPSNLVSEPSLMLLPDPFVRRLARESLRRDPRVDAEFLEDAATPDLDAAVDSAVVQARRMADLAYGRVMLATTHPRPFYPVHEDTLQIPDEDGISP